MGLKELRFNKSCSLFVENSFPVNMTAKEKTRSYSFVTQCEEMQRAHKSNIMLLKTDHLPVTKT